MAPLSWPTAMRHPSWDRARLLSAVWPASTQKRQSPHPRSLRGGRGVGGLKRQSPYTLTYQTLNVWSHDPTP